jgi:hypothetical protein
VVQHSITYTDCCMSFHCKAMQAPLEQVSSIEGSSLYLKSTSCFRLGDGWMWHRIYWRKTSHIALQLKNDLGFPNNQRRWNLHVTYFLQFLQLWIDFYLQG